MDDFTNELNPIEVDNALTKVELSKLNRLRSLAGTFLEHPRGESAFTHRKEILELIKKFVHCDSREAFDAYRALARKIIPELKPWNYCYSGRQWVNQAREAADLSNTLRDVFVGLDIKEVTLPPGISSIGDWLTVTITDGEGKVIGTGRAVVADDEDEEEEEDEYDIDLDDDDEDDDDDDEDIDDEDPEDEDEEERL